MAAFRDSDLSYADASGQDRERLDWALLKNGPVALFHKPEVLNETTEWLRAHGYAVVVADCGRDPSKQGTLDAITGALGFPPGANLDGFDDYCWQLEVPDDGGFALVLMPYDRVAAAGRKLAEEVLDILAGAAWEKMLFGRRFLCLVQSDDPRLDFRPVGAHTPTWNPRECFFKYRGL